MLRAHANQYSTKQQNQIKKLLMKGRSAVVCIFSAGYGDELFPSVNAYGVIKGMNSCVAVVYLYFNKAPKLAHKK